MSRADSLEAEVARLRAALDRIASVNPTHPNCETVVSMARAALNRKPAPVLMQEPAPEPVAPEQEEFAAMAAM